MCTVITESSLQPTQWSLHKFHLFYLPDNRFCELPVGCGRKTDAPQFQLKTKKAIFFSPPQMFSLWWSVFAQFLSLRSGSFSSFGRMTSPVQWPWSGSCPHSHNPPSPSPGNTPQRPPCYKIAFRINGNESLLWVCPELIAKTLTFVWLFFVFVVFFYFFPCPGFFFFFA